MKNFCEYLKKKKVVNEIFYLCEACNEGLTSDYVDKYCCSNWRECEHIFIPSKSHLKGKWNDIIGLYDIKKELVQKVQNPLLLSKKGIKVEPVKVLILFGPDGCMKTELIHALAHECKANLEIVSIRQIEELNSKIDEIGSNDPTIIMINEVDIIAPPIESKQIYLATFRMQDPLITLMSAIHKIKNSDKPIILIMVTDNPELVSPLILKQEYISDIIYVHPPNEKDRKEILEKILSDKPIDDDVDIDLLAKKTVNYSVQDLYKLVRTAELKWAEELFESNKKLSMKYFLDAFDEIIPSLTKSLIQQYEITAIRYGAIEKKISKRNLTWDDVGGYDSVKKQLQDIVSMLTSKDMYEKYGVHAPTGILLFGPPGCGKTYIAKVLADTTQSNFIYASAPDLLSKWLGESEQKIRELFTTAKLNPPTILFFDELDGLAFQRAKTTDHPYLTTILSTFLSEFSELTPEDRVLVIGATNRIEDIDPAFLRPGRFDERIAIPPPDFKARKEIFKVHLKNVELADDVDFDYLAKITENYTGAEIAYICDTTKRNKAIEAVNKGKYEKICMNDLLNTIELTNPDLSTEDIEEFNETFEKYSRTGKTPVKHIINPVYWDDIGGLKDVKEFLIKHVAQPLIHYKESIEFGINPKKGIIIYGLPGTGKTLLAEALSTETKANFFRYSALELSKVFLYRGDTPRDFKKFIRDAARVAPSIILLERAETIESFEIALFIQNEIEKIKKETPVLFICETINFEGIPEVLKASNQIQYIIIVPPPNEQERIEILKIKTKKMPLKENFNFSIIAEKTNYYTGSDLEKLTREAAHIAFTRKLNNDINTRITEEDFIKAMKIVKPSLTPEMINMFKKSVDNIQKTKTSIGYYA